MPTNWVDDLWGSSATATTPPPEQQDRSWVNDIWGQQNAQAPQPTPIQDATAPDTAPTAEAPAAADEPAQPPVDDYYKNLLAQNEAQKNQLRSQGIPEEGLSAAIAQQNLQQGAADQVANTPDNAFHSFEQSFPVRTAMGAVQGLGESLAGTTLTGIGAITGSNAFKDAAQHVYDVGREREATNSYLNAGSSLKNAIQGGVDIIAQAAPLAEAGLPAMAAYFGSSSAARSLSDAEQRGESTKAAYAQAATHGTIDAVWTLLGGKLGSGIAQLAGADSAGALGKAIGKLTEDIQLPSWAKVAGSIAEGTAGQVTQGIGMGASHYLGDVALGKRAFDADEFKQAMTSTIAPSLIAGAAGSAIHKFIGETADAIGQRVEELPKAIETAAKEQPKDIAARQPTDDQWSNAEDDLKSRLTAMQPSGNPVTDGWNAGQHVSDVAKQHGVDIKDLADRVLAPRGAEVTQPPAAEQSPPSAIEPIPPPQPFQPDQPAEVSPSPAEAPLQPPVNSDSSPEPPAASNTAHTSEQSTAEEGDTSFDFGANVHAERAPLVTREKQFIKRRLQRLEKNDAMPEDFANLDQHTIHDIISEADQRAGVDNQYISAVRDEYRQAGLNSIAAQARLRERRGGDADKIPRFDQKVQALRDGDYPALAAEASARGGGDLESGLYDIMQGGAKQFADKHGDDYIDDVLGAYRESQAKLQPGTQEAPGSQEQGNAAQPSGGESGGARPEAGSQEDVVPFSLSREGSPNIAPVTEPFQVPESQRLPAQSPAERQPNLEGMPTDMEAGTLPGQKGLFNQPAEPSVLGFGGGAKVLPRLVADTPEQLTALVRTHTPGLEIAQGLKKAKEGITSLLLPSMNSPEHLRAAEQLGAELGLMNRRSESSAHELRPYDKMFTRLGLDREGIDPERNPGTQFRAAMSTGREVTGKFRKAADAITKLFGERVQKLAEVDAPIQQVRDNYFPGMWTTESRQAFNAALHEAITEGVLPEHFDPNDVTDKQKAWVKARVDEHLSNGTGSDKDALQYLTRTPMAGKESFRKPKVFDDVLTAEKFGLRPISNNPIDLVKLKLAEIDKSIMAHGYFQKLKSQGKLETIDPYQQVAPDWVKVNDKYGTIYGPPTVKVYEHIDKAVYEGLLGVASNLGISHERLMTLPRKGALGLSYQGGDKIQSKFGTETSVIAHEIGHQLDHRYDLWDSILRKDNGKGFDPGRSELRDIADLTERGPKARTKEEKVAQVLEAYVHAPEKMQEVAPRVYDWFDKFVKSKPELKALADIKPGLALKKLTSEKYVGLPITGYRIVPKAEGDIINNYLSSSLYNNQYFGGMYKAWMGTANTLNQTQLGIGSAFHAGFTTGEAQIASNANVLKDVYGLVRGNRSLDDLKSTLGKSATAMVRTAMTGDKVLNAWRNPDGVIDPKVAQIVKAAELGGGGFKLETGLQTEQAAKMARDWYSGKRFSAAVRSPVAAVELMAKPIMEYLVPRQKAGVFADLAGRIIDQNPGKSLEDLTPEFRQAWNRVDARLGQARYNRLFTNNTAKNVIQGLVRAPGWSGGTIAEIGGAFPDAAKFVSDWVKTGKPPQELPDRVAYSLALISSVAAVNGALTYAFTGQTPKGLDYFAFRDGNKDENGKETRLLLPTYVKDLLAYWRDPGQTLVNKTHPLISLVSELANNRDYYGTQIRNGGDSAVKQAADTAGYVAKAFVPFWLRGVQKVREQGGGAKELALPYVGVMPAPKHITETDAERTAREAMQKRLPNTRTQADAAAAQERSGIKQSLRRGDREPLKGAIAAGDLSPRSAKSVLKSSGRPPLVNMVKPLSADEALDVWAKASDEERATLKSTVIVKVRNAIKGAAPVTRRAIIDKARATGVLPQPASTEVPRR